MLLSLFDSKRRRMQSEFLRNIQLTRDKNTSGSKLVLESFLSDLCFWTGFEPKRDNDGLCGRNATRVNRNLSKGHSKKRRSIPTMKEAMDMGFDRKFSHDMGSDSSIEEFPKAIWKKATDPTTGKTYYYDAISRKSQWKKPAELRALERRKKMERRRIAREFFDEMEKNIIDSLSRGELIPGIPLDETRNEGPPQEPLTKSHVRTISAMHGVLLEELGLDLNSNAPFDRERQNIRNDKANQRNATARNSVAVKGRPPLPGARCSTQSSRAASPRKSPPDSATKNGFIPSQRPIHIPQSLVPSDPDSELAGEKLLEGPIQNEFFEMQTPQPQNSPKRTVGHTRRNTGGTIYLKNFMTNPNVQATIKCVCGIYRAHIGQSMDSVKLDKHEDMQSLPEFDIFHDNFRSQRAKKSLPILPSLSEILEFYEAFYQRSQMEHDTIIFSLIYVERLIKATEGMLVPSPQNWRSFLFSCMVLASKVWDDLSMWNYDFANVTAHTNGLTCFTLSRINELELALLKCLSFNVRVNASEYAKYYFLIRTMLQRSGLVKEDQKPLGKREAFEKLESLTSPYFGRCSTSEPRDRRSKSMDGGIFNALPNEDLDGLDPVLRDSICLEQLLT